MKILVTGANGYIGRHVVLQLLEMGHEVIACDISLADIDSRAIKKELNLLSNDYDNIYVKLGAPDVCLHMAWRDGFIHNSDNHIKDLSLHYNFLTAIISGGLKQLAVMGSMHEVGYHKGVIDEFTPCDPISLYGIAKDALRRSMIEYCKTNKCTFQWLRGYYILGDDRKNHSIFTKLLEAESIGKEKFPFTTGKTKYDFLDVAELSHQIASVVSQDQVNGIINCCSGNPVSLAEKVEEYIKENGLKIKLEYGAFPDRPYDSPIIYGDATKINQILANRHHSL